MKPAELVTLVPKNLQGEEAAKIAQALTQILLKMDSFEPLQAAGGDIFINTAPIRAAATRGFFHPPTIDGLGPPLGTPANRFGGDPIVITRGDGRMWRYDFTLRAWIEIPPAVDVEEIKELLFLILQEVQRL